MKKVIWIGLVVGLPLLASQFTLSGQSITPYGSAKDVCISEFGSEANVASWSDFKAFLLKQTDINATMYDIGLDAYDSSAVVTYGDAFWENGDRHYFMALHYGHLPASYFFLSHDDVLDHYISLGSWNDYMYPVLCELHANN